MSVLFGDVEDALYTYLTPILDPVPVRTIVPTQTAPPYLIIQRIGGPTETVVSEVATVAIEAWAASDKRAHDLCQQARQALHALPNEIVNGLVFYRVQEFAGPARLPDAVSAISGASGSGKRRYVLTVALTVRGFTSS